MRVYLNAGFGSPIGADDLSLIHSLGYAGVRQDVPSRFDAKTLVLDLAGADLRPLWLVPLSLDHSTEQTVEALIYESARAWTPYEYALEIGNEENLTTDAALYAQRFGEVEVLARSILSSVQLVTAGISTTSREALRWLERALVGSSLDAIVGYHTYRQDPYPSPFEPQKGFSSRADEFEELQRIASGRRLWNTEIGWHTAPRKRGCWFWKRTFRLSDIDVLGYLKDELRLNDAAGADVTTIYQLNDGPTDTPEDRFGIRTFEGDLKPQAYAPLPSTTLRTLEDR